MGRVAKIRAVQGEPPWRWLFGQEMLCRRQTKPNSNTSISIPAPKRKVGARRCGHNNLLSRQRTFLQDCLITCGFDGIQESV